MSAPATAFALGRLGSTTKYEIGPNERLVFLTVAALADHSGVRGGVGAGTVAPIAGLATSTTTTILRRLAGRGDLVLVTTRATVRHHYTGRAAQRNLSRGERIVGFRLPDEAFTGREEAAR